MMSLKSLNGSLAILKGSWFRCTLLTTLFGWIHLESLRFIRKGNAVLHRMAAGFNWALLTNELEVFPMYLVPHCKL